MINITIRDTQYKVYESERWDEITIDKCIELTKLIHSECPKSLLEFYNEVGNEESEYEHNPTEKELIREYPAFYGKVIECLSDVPNEVVKKILPHDRTVFYKEYLEWFVIRMLYTDYLSKPYDKDYFEYKKVRYLFPESEEVIGTMIPAYKTSAVEFAEASDVLIALKELEGGNLEAVKQMIAIYCRPQGEPYNEHEAIKRAKEFGGLSMDIAYAVFFCIMRYISQYMNDTLISQVDQVLKQRKHQNPQDSTHSGGWAALLMQLKKLIKA